MIKKCILGLLLGLAVAPAALADFSFTPPVPTGSTISFNPTLNGSFGGGGQFTANLKGSSTFQLFFQGVQVNLGGGGSVPGGTLQTFCAEPLLPLNQGVNYGITLTLTDHSNNPLKLGTAFLFSTFTSGAMSDYDYNRDAGNVADAKLMQEAIWHFQGQPAPNSNFQVDDPNNKFVQDAMKALGASTGNDSNGQYGVWLLQPTSANGKANQDVLVQVPVPDGGTTAMLLGSVFVGLGFARRKLG